MLSNVVDIQHAGQLTALDREHGAILLFDFKAAFPSLNHHYLHRVLAKLGLPRDVLRMIQMLYHEHGCVINFAGDSFQGFPIYAGIRQGCPLSPLLFALVVDLLLRRIKRDLPDCTVRAFADDIALIVPDIHASLPVLHRIFFEINQIVNLELHLPKCVFIPLWRGNCGDTQEHICRHFPEWGSMKVEHWGYLSGLRSWA